MKVKKPKEIWSNIFCLYKKKFGEYPRENEALDPSLFLPGVFYCQLHDPGMKKKIYPAGRRLYQYMVACIPFSRARKMARFYQAVMHKRKLCNIVYLAKSGMTFMPIVIAYYTHYAVNFSLEHLYCPPSKA